MNQSKIGWNDDNANPLKIILVEQRFNDAFKNWRILKM